MNDLTLINDWLKNKNRSFVLGLTIYNKYKINSKKDDFFAKANANAPDGVTMGMLLQEIIKIHIKLINNPKLIEAKASQSIITTQTIITSVTPKKSIKVKIETDKIKESDLPEELKPVFKRIQEIMPILGAKHASLKAETDESNSKILAEDIVRLDDEKRELWAKIDSWYKSKNVTLIIQDISEQNQPQILTPFQKIMAIEDLEIRLIEINKREKIVTDDITRANVKLEDFKKNKPHLVKQKQDSIAEKELEVKKLQDARADIMKDK